MLLGINILIVFSRPWLCYWILHSIALLGDSVDTALEHNAIDFLSRCQVCDILLWFSLGLCLQLYKCIDCETFVSSFYQDQHGGYGGGPGQASDFLVMIVN